MAIKKIDSRMIRVPATIEQINSVSLSAGAIYSNNVNVFNGLTVFGTISALSGYEIIVSETSQTSALDISNIAPIPALTVSQGIASPVVATFSHDGNEIMIVSNNGVQTDSVTAPTVTADYIRTADLYFEQGGGVVSDAAFFGNVTIYGAISALSGLTGATGSFATQTTTLSVQSLTANAITTNLVLQEITTNVTLNNSDSNKIFHCNTTTTPIISAIFPSTLSNGFNVGLYNMGTGTIVISSTRVPAVCALGIKNNTPFTGITIYKLNNTLFGIGVFN